MPVLEWSAQLETGVFEIDLQHRSLLAIANQLHDAVETGKAERTVEWMLQELAFYARFHFQTEEAYMRRYGLDMSSEHRDEHGQLLLALKRFRRQLKADHDAVYDDLLEFLGQWLTQHLQGTDRDLGLAVRMAMAQPESKRRRKPDA